MSKFGRIVKLGVGAAGSVGHEVSDNRISFKVKKTDKAESNSLEVSIYNANPDTRALLENTKNRIQLSVGYEGEEVTQVAVGDITHGKTDYQHPDIITTAECGDGLVSIRDSRISLSYASSVMVDQVIKDIAEAMGFPIKKTDADLTGTYSRGWAFSGSAKTGLTQVLNRFGLDWSVQNEEIQIANRRSPVSDEVILISPASGMVGSPEKKDDKKTDREDDKEKPGLIMTTLLNPLIEPRTIIAIESRDFPQNQYLVTSVEHSGDTHTNDWYSKIEVSEL